MKIGLEPERESQLGICYECSTKHADSSQKPVYRCDLCKKWFCKKHLEPKYPYFVDWDTVFDVQGDPRIKASFYTEYKREGGHPDFVYLQNAIKEFQLEEKIRDMLIARTIEKMIEADRKRRDEKREKEAREREAKEAEVRAFERATGNTMTTGNRYGKRFVVPLEIYSNATYREYLDHAKT